jgi:hypothetical protein
VENPPIRGARDGGRLCAMRGFDIAELLKLPVEEKLPDILAG